ncbi:DNA repair protein RecO [Patescibacteria group bacterium]|nr:DNA repair protein RecO [Patescibacteria group bacterium]MBU1703008.1 DNA repair protein RecO [Patescibacteria group bacterium]
MRSIQTTGIIIGKRSFGEHDQFVNIFSPDLGKIDAVAKGARKITGSFTGHLETLNICKLQLHKSARGYTVTECRIEHGFNKIRNSLELSMIAFLLLEIFSKIAQTQEQSVELFNLITGTLTGLEENQNADLYTGAFKVKILNMSGALPDISRCGSCNRRWTEADHINLNNEGHIFCDGCGNQSTENRLTQKAAITWNTMKLIHFLSSSNQKQIQKIKISKKETADFKIIIDIFLHNYMACELKSEKIYAGMK